MRLEALDVFPVLETERLILTKIEPFYLESFYEIFSKEKVMEKYGMFPITELKDGAWFIERFNDSFKNKRSIRWGLILKSNHKLIGTCGFHGFNELSSRAEMGYELDDQYWHKGLMREALEAIIKWGFTTFELNRIEALIYPDNVASEQIVIRNGFVFEGCLRQYAYFRNVYQDLNMYSLLKEEWLIHENISSRG
ncbi:GNAT family N-acetyltransferase [Fusibacter sp. 3D3]|uniref:GNAT family N-acetyltransferase n=1 Tax=Fusibacter sp. 3D3 TaxID=1048380 RepID=UPI000853D4FE|nr:GNAT family protein [Fusibacter sp. 3D3]GAU78985.1 GNAT family acetyltransferase Bsu1853 [Fusibacter sp. 3D3]